MWARARMAPMLRTSVPPMSFACDPKTCSTRARTLAFVLLPCFSRLVSFFAADPFRMILLSYPSSSSNASTSFERYALSAHTGAAVLSGSSTSPITWLSCVAASVTV